MKRNSPRAKFVFVLFVAGLMCYSGWTLVEHRRSMRPIVVGELANRLRLAELEGQLADARKEIDGKTEIERQTASAREDLLRWSNGKVPVGPSKVWFPVWLKERLESIGITESQIRLNTEIPEPGLSGFKRSFWNVNLPAQAGLSDIPKLLLALQDIQEREPLIKILDCTLHPGPEGLHSLTGTFNVEAIVED